MKKITTEEALEIVLEDEESIMILTQHLMAKKCVDIGIQFPGSIGELLAKFTDSGENVK